MLIKRVILCLLVSSGVHAVTPPLALPTLKVRSYSRVFENKKISLIDVVETANLNPDTEKKLAAISLGDAPKLGEQRTYSSKVIAEAIRQNQIKKSWNIQIPYNVIVENKGYDLDKESIARELLSRWQAQCVGCEIEIKSMQLPVVPAALAKRPWSVDGTSNFPRGTFAQKLLVTSEDGRAQTFWINGQIEVKKKVPVLTRSTPMSTRFTEEDFQFEMRDVTFATDTTPTAAEIIGQQSKYTMNANDIIWKNSIIREKAVQRGEMVKVSVADGSWEVSVQARTEQDGYIGDTVNLRNLQSNRIITGRVIGSGEVEIR